MSKRLTTLLCNLMVFLGGSSTDIYLPSLPSMRTFFHSSAQSIQISIGAFALGMALTQLLVGPISDAKGRKKILALGLLVQMSALITIIFSHHAAILITGRILHGIGVAMMMVSARAMISDMYSGKELKHRFSTLTFYFALSPIVAPWIGSFLEHFFSWQANFIALLIGITLLLATIPHIIESNEHLHPLRFRTVALSYRSVLTQHIFFKGTLFIGFLNGFMAIYIVIAPFLLQVSLHKSPLFYGNLSLVMGAAWCIGNILSRKALHVALTKKTTFCLFAMFMSTTLMLGLSFFELNIYQFTIPTFILIMFAGFLFPTFVAEVMSQFKQHAASANGVLFSIAWLISSLFSYLGSFLSYKSILPLSTLYMALVAVLIAIYLFLLRPKLRMQGA